MNRAKKRLSRSETFFRMRQNGEHLFLGDAGKPLQKLIYRSAFFKVLEKRAHRHSCALKHPGATHASGHPFDRITFIPIEHPRRVS